MGIGGPLLAARSGLSARDERIAGRDPVRSGQFHDALVLHRSGLALALGFRQSAWEPHQGTALYLLHLPLSRCTIILTKLIAGIGLLAAVQPDADCHLCRLGGHARYARRPVRMDDDRFGVPDLDDLAARLSRGVCQRHPPGAGLARALLPLCSVALPSTLCFAIGPWWLLGFPLLCLTAAVLVSDILWVAGTRDY